MNNIQCCFCNSSIISTDKDPCEVIINTNWDKSLEKQSDQSFWCHLDCFKEKMHKSIQQHLLVHLVEN